MNEPLYQEGGINYVLGADFGIITSTGEAIDSAVIRGISTAFVIRDKKTTGCYVKIDISNFTCNNRKNLSAV